MLCWHPCIHSQKHDTQAYHPVAKGLILDCIRVVGHPRYPPCPVHQCIVRMCVYPPPPSQARFARQQGESHSKRREESEDWGFVIDWGLHFVVAELGFAASGGQGDGRRQHLVQPMKQLYFFTYYKDVTVT